MIKLDFVTCKYNNKTILEDISLNIDAHLSILGANGSGKSTLTKAISNLISYDGKITIDDKDITKLSFKQRAKSISYIPTKLDIYDDSITVKEFVLMSRFAYKKSFTNYLDADKKIVAKNLEFLNISHLKEESLATLSSGEIQLTLIASALSQESKIIIFDEPTANLDPKNSKKIAKEIKKLKLKHQIILVTHDLHLASYIDSPILFIKDKKATYYEDNFFTEETLSELYGVKFNGLAVKYD
jgi:iron complex transport system ATP-binding protein